MKIAFRTMALFKVCLLIFSCGESDSQLDSTSNRVYWPDRDMEGNGDGLWGAMNLGEDDMIGSGKWRNRYWLNFEGATVSAKESFIVDKAGVDSLPIPAFQPADLGSAFEADDRTTLIQAIFEAVAQDFEGINVELSLTEPAAPYSVAHIGGNNFTGRENTLAGLSPIADRKPTKGLRGRPSELGWV